MEGEADLIFVSDSELANRALKFTSLLIKFNLNTLYMYQKFMQQTLSGL